MTDQGWNPETLNWLPKPPPDFAQRCRQILETPGDLGNRVRALASHDLDENQLNRIANVIGKAEAQELSLAPLQPFRLGILSNSTTDFIVPAFIASACRHGIALECVRS